MVAASVAAPHRRKVLIIGIALATFMRICFALVTIQLLQVPGLLFIGGILLFWVAWKLWRDLSQKSKENYAQRKKGDQSLRRAILHIAVADISMSLDNVLAVAGIARHHPVILIFGLVLSIILMAVGATMVTKALERYRWIAYVGLAVILYIAGSMSLSGLNDLTTYMM